MKSNKTDLTVINNIVRIMKEKNIRPCDLARNTNIKQSTFTGWKNGAQPTANKLLDIIDYLKISPNELFGYNEKSNTILNENEREMLNFYQKLPEREQLKVIGIIEERLKIIPGCRTTSSTSTTGSTETDDKNTDNYTKITV